MATEFTDLGPALCEVLAAQREDDEAVGYGQLERHAMALSELSSKLGDPIVWPVGPAAERIAGAATILGGGNLRVRGGTTDLTAQRVLILAVAAVTPLPLLQAAGRARALGAAEVLGCGVRIQGIHAGQESEFLDRYIQLA